MKIPIKLKLKPREKRVVLIGGIIAIAIISYQVFIWYSDLRESIREYSDVVGTNLQKQAIRISEKGVILKKIEAVDSQLKELEKGLLSGDKPPVAAAELQRLLKDMALSLDIEIKSERTLSPVDKGLYMSLPVEIGFIASTAKLKSMLYEIKTSTFLLTVSGMNIRVTNVSNPADVYTTLVVNGFIKKPGAASPSKAEEKEKGA